MLLSNGIAFGARPQFNSIGERERMPHVGAGGAIVAEERVDGAVGLDPERKSLIRPARECFRIGAVLRMAIEHRGTGLDGFTGRPRRAPIQGAAKLAWTERTSLAGDEGRQSLQAVGVARESEGCQLRLLRPQHAGVEHVDG